MKKIFLALILVLFLSPSVFAQDILGEKKASPKAPSVVIKNVFHKKAAKVQAEAPTDDDNLTSSQQANLFYADNNVKKAFELLLSISEGNRTAQDWLLLGNLLQDQEKNSDAMFMYQRAIMINPKFYKAYYNLGNIYLADEKPYSAIENYRKANKANPTFAYAYYNLGCAYLQAGELKKAKIAFLKAVELKNGEPDFYYNAAYAYKKLDKPKLAKQYLNLYNKALELRGE